MTDSLPSKERYIPRGRMVIDAETQDLVAECWSTESLQLVTDALNSRHTRASVPPSDAPPSKMLVTELIRQMRGRAAAADAGGRVEVLLSDLRNMLAITSQSPPATRCNCGAQQWPDDCVQIEDSHGRLHTLRGCQPGASVTKPGSDT